MLADRVRMGVAKDDSSPVTVEFEIGQMLTQTLFDSDDIEVFSTNGDITYELEINKVYTLYLTYNNDYGFVGYGNFKINAVTIYNAYSEMPTPYTINDIRVLSYNQFGRYSGKFEISFEILSSDSSLHITHSIDN